MSRVPEIKDFMKKEDIVDLARVQAMTMIKWALSCKTKEQLDNVVNFMHNHQWTMNGVTEKSVKFWQGSCYGAVLMLNKTKFK